MFKLVRIEVLGYKNFVYKLMFSSCYNYEYLSFVFSLLIDNDSNDATNYSTELGEVIATIEIPRLNIKEEVYYGHDYLDYHNLILDENYKQTGEGKKVVIAGHKENISEYLKQKEGGDQIILTTSMGTYNYEVKNIEVVNQNDTEILEENINEE